MHAGLCGLHRIVLVMDGRGRAGEIVDLVDFHIKREGDIVPDHFEVFVFKQMLDITARAGEEIVDADDDRSVGQQALAEMRTEKASAAGDEHAFFEMHISRIRRLFHRIPVCGAIALYHRCLGRNSLRELMASRTRCRLPRRANSHSRRRRPRVEGMLASTKIT
jgi:hypothetical protein